MVLNRETVLKALHNETVDQVPTSFWRHFADNEFTNAATNPSVLTTNLTGHRSYYQAVDVDFAKRCSTATSPTRSTGSRIQKTCPTSTTCGPSQTTTPS